MVRTCGCSGPSQASNNASPATAANAATCWGRSPTPCDPGRRPTTTTAGPGSVPGPLGLEVHSQLGVIDLEGRPIGGDRRGVGIGLQLLDGRLDGRVRVDRRV